MRKVAVANKENSNNPGTTVKIEVFTSGDHDAVVDLWRRCDLVRPWNDPDKDIARKLADSPDLFFIARLQQGHVEDKTPLVAAAMAGYEGHRGWVNYLAVDPQYRGTGIGKEIMQHIEAELLSRGCPKINLQVRETNTDVIAFYRSIGYDVDAAVSMGKRLIPDN